MWHVLLSLIPTASPAPRAVDLPRVPSGLQARVRAGDTSDVQIVMVFDDALAAATAQLPPGALVQARSGRRVQVSLPADLLPALSDQPHLQLIRRPHRAALKSTADVGNVVTEGAEDIFQTDDWHAAGGLGRGVDVVVLDVGFEGLSELRGTELPRKVSSTTDPEVNTEHGAAVAEIVHDIAPGARMHVRVFNTGVELLQMIDELRISGPDVVNASIGFDNIWHADGTSPYSQAVTALVADRNVVWVAAAGNEATRYRWGALSDDDADGLLEIDGVEGVRLTTWGGAAEVSLRWSEPMDAATTDLDLALYDATGLLCGESRDAQDGPPSAPYESTSGLCDTRWAVAYPTAPVGTNLDGLTAWIYSPPGVEDEWQTADATLTLPADAVGALAVGACDADRVAWYSSRGPTDDGRNKPDVCAPSGVSTSTYGPLGFAGTSAAAPHAAGVVALLLAAPRLVDRPITTAKGAIDELQARADDLGTEGVDPRTGAGALRAGPVPQCACASRSTPPTPMVLIWIALLIGRRRRSIADIALAKPKRTG